VELHYTPNHGSWLNMAQIELSVLARQCLGQRLPDLADLRREVAWEAARSAAGQAIDWRFTAAAARSNLKRRYPIAADGGTGEPQNRVCREAFHPWLPRAMPITRERQPMDRLRARHVPAAVAAAWAWASAYALLAAAVAWGVLAPFDLALGRAAARGVPCAVSNASATASVLFAGELSVAYAAALAALCAAHGRRRAGAAILAGLFATVAIELLSKAFLPQSAPGDVLQSAALAACAGPGYPLTLVATPNSFPSGYAIRCAYFGLLLGALLGARWPRRARAIRALLGLAVALLAGSRAVILWHWSSDIVAGLCLGLAAGSVVLALAQDCHWLQHGGEGAADGLSRAPGHPPT